MVAAQRILPGAGTMARGAEGEEGESS